jgi:hypothetical protein
VQYSLRLNSLNAIPPKSRSKRISTIRAVELDRGCENVVISNSLEEEGATCSGERCEG